MKKYTFGFIGFGLIGGSIAKALKNKLPDCTIYAYMRSHIKLEMAKEDGIVDVILNDIDTSFSHCDLIFLCTPVEYNAQYLEKLKPIIHSKCIITDVGSTKSSIHESVKLLGLEKNFIGGHPMAGSEKTGYENSDELLLENAYYILTPTKKTREKDLDTLTALTKLMGAIPFVMDCAEHDKTVATISHLPHLVAAALVNLVKETDNSNGVMKQLAAGGFKDITRIASSSPIMWDQICETNREAILKVLDIYLDSLKKSEMVLKIISHPQSISSLKNPAAIETLSAIMSEDSSVLSTVFLFKWLTDQDPFLLFLPSLLLIPSALKTLALITIVNLARVHFALPSMAWKTAIWRQNY